MKGERTDQLRGANPGRIGRPRGRTTHLVLARVLALSAADAERRRRLRSYCFYSFKPRRHGVGASSGRARALVLILDDNGARAAGKRVADRHCCGS
jgi:hypothetical protein